MFAMPRKSGTLGGVALSVVEYVISYSVLFLFFSIHVSKQRKKKKKMKMKMKKKRNL